MASTARRHSRLPYAMMLSVVLCLPLLSCAATDDMSAKLSSVEKRVTRSLATAAAGSESQKNYQSAVIYYAKLLERDPENPELTAALARSLRMLHKPNEARGYAQTALVKHKQHPLLLAELGKAQLALGEPMKAIENLSKSDALAADNWQTIVALAVAFDRIAMYDQSERRYRRAMEISPKNINVLNNYALSKAQNGKFEEATKMLEEASGLPGADPQVRQNLAMMYALQGDLIKAEALLRRDLKPEYAEQNLNYYRNVRLSKQGQLPKEVLRKFESSRGGADLKTPLVTEVDLVPVESMHVALRDTAIRQAPSSTGLRIDELAKGLTIYVAARTVNGPWALVERQGKMVGYVLQSHLQDLGIAGAKKNSGEGPNLKAQPVSPVVAAKVEPGKTETPTPAQVKQPPPAPAKPVTKQAAAKKGDAFANPPKPKQKPVHKVAAATPEKAVKEAPAAPVKEPAAKVAATTVPVKPKAPSYRVGQVLRDCRGCPVLLVIPTGQFMMGAAPNEARRSRREMPQHKVIVPWKLAVGKFEVTFAEWDLCVADGGCNNRARDEGWGRERRPAINVSWKDAQEYVTWLSKRSGKPYRLLSEAEWEYAVRAGTATAYHVGAKINPGQARFKSVSSAASQEKTTTVGQFAPNLFGLFDMHGNAREWTEDCRHDDYRGAPSDGDAWVSGGNCQYRVIRGGSWGDRSAFLRSAYRSWTKPSNRSYAVGFRVARELQ